MGKIAVISLMLCVLIVLAPMVFMERGEQIPAAMEEKEEFTVIPADERTEESMEAAVESEEVHSIDSETIIPVLVDGKVQYLTLDKYLEGVIAAEMPASFPDEALKAQAVAARTYIIHKRSLVEAGETIDPSHKGAIMCDDHTHCSAYTDLAVNASSVFGDNAEIYAEKIAKAVSDTDGMIMMYDGEPISAAFHAISGGMTESASDVWGSDVPYLRSVESKEDESAAMYTSEVSYSIDEFRALMSSQLPDADLSSAAEEWFKDSVRSGAGGIITVELGGVKVQGTWLRSVLSLASTDFTVKVEDNTIIITCTGYGHGVGMSQYGAKMMADSGKTYDDILKHYYTDVDLVMIEQ